MAEKPRNGFQLGNMNADTIGNYNMKQGNCPKSSLKGEKKKEQVTKSIVLSILKQDQPFSR
jgi:hypothetical protein